jgi:prepilin-type processing-associated H-X9-DG protein
MLAATGAGGPAQPVFASAADVPGAGVLCAIPALVANGLFHGADRRFALPSSYYPLPALLLLFAFLALARVKSLERIRYQQPGEWGRMLGLDRIPEVKTLREKLETIAQPAAVSAWAEDLSSFWMRLDENLAGVLYVDGHVRTYTGAQTELPRRFSSSDRLCLRSLIDYWVNDTHGTPFFVVTAMGNEGMIHHLRETIIPRLLREVPHQPSEAELSADPDRHRFVLVFDREGWSPAFFATLWRDHRIAVQTYRRGTYDAWPVETFTEQVVPVAYGNTTRMPLAEQELEHADCVATAEATAVKLREIRRLCDGRSHQTAIITTVRQGDMAQIAGHMFARWAQENFFKYAERELSIDRLAGYATAEAPGNETIKNPAYVEFDARIRRLRADITATRAERGRLVLEANDSESVRQHLLQCQPFDQRLTDLDQQRRDLLAKRRATPKRIALRDLPPERRPRFIAPARTQLLNTIRIAAYRAETALALELRQHLARHDDARALIQDLFTHDADLVFDENARTLTVRVHHFANPQSSRAMAAVLDGLTQTETTYPGTNLVLRYQLVSPPSPAGQEV